MELFSFKKGEKFPVISPSTIVCREPLFYVPDGTERVEIVTFEYVTISKNGKHIAPGFVGRYIKGYGKGVHIIPHGIKEKDFILRNYLDHSIIIESAQPIPGNISNCTTGEISLCEAVCIASEYTMLRSGDIIIVEGDSDFMETHPDTSQRIKRGDLEITLIS